MKPLRPAVAGPARASLALLLAAACPPLAAEPLGLLAGRTADPALQPALSLEAGYIVLDDGSFVGGRVNFRAAERVVLYGDVGRFEGDDDEVGLELSGTPFGVGLFYLLPETSAVADLAVRASYHTTDIDIDLILRNSLMDGTLNFSLFNQMTLPVGLLIEPNSSVYFICQVLILIQVII